jgi:hypothetical protein
MPATGFQGWGKHDTDFPSLGKRKLQLGMMAGSPTRRTHGQQKLHHSKKPK